MTVLRYISHHDELNFAKIICLIWKQNGNEDSW